MYDVIPAPFGDVTRRWSLLSRDERDRHAWRLVGVSLAEAAIAQPDADTFVHYRRLVAAAAGGDPVAFAWLATTHRPLLLVRGRAIYDDDPAEWGSVCLEALHITLMQANPAAGRWLRRQVALRLSARVLRATRQHLRRRAHELVTDPGRLPIESVPAVDFDPHLELTVRVATLMRRVEPATRDGLQALADREPLAPVAARHAMAAPALRQRLVRARPALCDQLAGYRRAPTR